MHEETVYDALDHAHGGEGQWAFGTGFDEPLAGVDTTVPDGVDPADLGAYCLMLGDDALVLAQRLTQWITAAPELEEEVAIGQHRPRPARPGPAAARPRRLGRRPRPVPRAGHRLASRTRTRWPTSATPTSSATPRWSRRRTATSRRRWSGCWSPPPSGWRVFARLRESRDPVLAAIAAKGVQRADLPPRPRRPLGAAPRRRHGGVAPPRAGRRRRGLAAAGRALHPHRRRAAADRGRGRRRPGGRPRRGARRAHRGARAGDADACPPGRPTPRRAAGSASTARSWPSCSAELQGLARAAPGGDLVSAVTDARIDATRGRWPRRSPTPSCRCSPSPTSACCATSAIEATAPSSSRSPRPTPAARPWASCAPTWCTRCTAAGFADVDVRTVLSPAWTHRLDQRRRAAASSPPAASPRPARRRSAPPGPVPLQLGPTRRTAACPLCGSPDTEELSEFGATACKALRRCRGCREPFEHVKEI